MCELCNKPLGDMKIFCFECQNECYYRLQNSSCYYEIKENQLVISLEKEPCLRKLFYLVQNPRNSFLIKALISLISLKLCSEKKLWPQAIVEGKVFSNRSINKQFLKMLHKSLCLPIVSQSNYPTEEKKIIFLLNR